MASVRPPDTFNWEERNLKKAWSEWHREFKLYTNIVRFVGNGADDAAKVLDVQKQKKSLLMYQIGRKGREIYDTFEFKDENGAAIEEDNRTLEMIEGKIKAYCEPTKTLVIDRVNFLRRDQLDGESFENYLLHLQTLANNCDWDNAKSNDMIVLNIIKGITNKILRDALLREKDLSLETCIRMCRATEQSRIQSNVIDDAPISDQIDAIRSLINCMFCHNRPRHVASKCPAKGKKCNSCDMFGHFANTKACQDGLGFNTGLYNSNGNINSSRGNKFSGNRANYFRGSSFRGSSFRGRGRGGRSRGYNQNSVTDEEACDGDYRYNEEHRDQNNASTVQEFMLTVQNTPKRISATLLVGNGESWSEIDFVLDTGATVNGIPFDFIKTNNLQDKLQHTNTVLTVFNNEEMKPKGEIYLDAKNPVDNQVIRTRFLVVDSNIQPILSCRAMMSFGFITVHYENFISKLVYKVEEEKKSDNFMEDARKKILKLKINKGTKDILYEYADVFEERVGAFEGELNIEVEENSVPVQQPIRNVPFAVEDSFKKELEQMIRDDIIEEVDGPCSWLNSFVLERKPSGELRICLDPKPLNKVLKRNYHCQIPSLDSIIHKFSNQNCMKFSKLDVKSGFWHYKLTDESKSLTAFGTPFGNFRYKRLPMGITPASAAFQSKMIKELQGLKGVDVIQDDCLVEGFGETEADALKIHDEHLRCYLQRCRERGIKINLSKCKFFADTVPYMGHVLTNQGVKADPEKVNAIVNFPVPHDLYHLQKFLGMVKYLGKFDNTLSTACEPLYRLTHKNQLFQWAEVQQVAFERVKQIIIKAPVLRYYDVKKPVTVQTDMSNAGMGAVLLQDGRPVTFASRVWRDAEKGYAPIEKEMRAIHFGLTRFSDYCFGRFVTVESDHKPLEAINKKALSDAPERIRNMLLSLQRFDFDIVYKPGKEVIIADCLSRAPVGATDNDKFELAEVNILDELAISDVYKEKLQKAADDDHDVQMLKKFICEGWPKYARDVPNSLRAYYGYREELSEKDSVIFKGDQILVPRGLRNYTKQRLHVSHLGVDSNLRRAKSLCFWPGMKNELEKIYANCKQCQEYARKNQREPFLQRELPDYPFQKIALDLATYSGKKYLICVDYFSNYTLVDWLRNETSAETIGHLKKHFMRFGLPMEVVSDGGPQFSSEEFRLFAKQYDFHWNPSSPRYPASNGMAESGVKQIKAILKKCGDEGSDPHVAILEFINTPSKTIGMSPAQRFFGRELRSIHPIKKSLLTPHNVEKVKSKLLESKSKQMAQYNKNAKTLPELNDGDQVMVEPYSRLSKWIPGAIVRKMPFRKYCVLLDNGRKLIRNRKYLRHREFEAPPEYHRYDFDANDEANNDFEQEEPQQQHDDPVNHFERQEPQYQPRHRRNPDRYGSWIYT